MDLTDIGIRDEENQTTQLLGSIHAMVDTHVQAVPPQQPTDAPPQYQPPRPQYQQPQPQGGGMMQQFLGGGFGRPIATGAGFGIGDELIQNIS